MAGATDGIGLAFARKFSNYNYNILLMGRNGEKLRDLQNTLKSLNP